MLSLNVSISSNPDRDEFEWSEEFVLSARNIQEMRKKIGAVQSEKDLGGGNWGEAVLSENGVLLGYVSYNGRVWSGKYWEGVSKEVLFAIDKA